MKQFSATLPHLFFCMASICTRPEVPVGAAAKQWDYQQTKK